MSKMAPVLPGMKAGWPRGTAPISSENKDVKNPSLTLNRQVNLYPLTNYTFGTKGKKLNPNKNQSFRQALNFIILLQLQKDGQESLQFKAQSLKTCQFIRNFLNTYYLHISIICDIYLHYILPEIGLLLSIIIFTIHTD